jgi:aminoglycoside phosphotransferase family enzyme/adenylate kinase family enzyme
VSLIQALLNPAAYPHPVTHIELIETHISWVLLTGQYAYKIKKNVQFDFLDFSTLDKRRFYCQEELRFNSRFAPDLYLQVVPITGSPQHPKMNGSGAAIEYAVQMKQFDGSQLLSHIADRGELSAAIIDQLAELTANFHKKAKSDTSNSHFGTPQETHHWFQGNFAHIRPLINNEGFLQQILQLEQWGEQALLKNKRLMELRKQQGFIRECHGDLHLGNITLIDGAVTPFDGIEFNPALHWIDVISEIAFVIMDLQQRGFNRLAYRFLNRYLSAGGGYEGLALLPYYLVYRALVRCKVALLRWEQHRKPQDLQEAENYANLAESYSQPQSPKLFITHGYSGSGKSTFSAQMTESLGIIHLRSDVERKRLINKPKPDISRQGAGNEVNQGLYTPENVLLVYHRLIELASPILDAGFSVLIDAAFLQFSQRELFAELAKKKQVDFVILDFYAPEQELKRRISERRQSGNDASEATLAVLEHQLKTAQAFSATELEKVIRIETCATVALNKLLQNNRLSKSN